jgi:hypothetical protein
MCPIYIYMLWRVRVAPLIIVGSGSLKSICWITRKSKLHLVTTIQLWTLDTLRQLNCSGLTCLLCRWLVTFDSLDWLTDWLTLYSISWGRLSADLREITSRQGSLHMSPIRLPREQSIPGRYRGNAYTGWFLRKRAQLSLAVSSAFHIPTFRQHVTI